MHWKILTIATIALTPSVFAERRLRTRVGHREKDTHRLTSTTNSLPSTLKKSSESLVPEATDRNEMRREPRALEESDVVTWKIVMKCSGRDSDEKTNEVSESQHNSAVTPTPENTSTKAPMERRP